MEYKIVSTSIIFLFLLVLCDGVAEWYMANYCSAQIEVNEYEGSINSGFEPSTPDTCEVSVVSLQLPELASKKRSQVLFYFTSFEFESCDREFLMINDGYSGRIPGLADKLCGVNDTLLRDDLYFVATEGRFRISYSRTGSVSKGQFTLLVSSFYDDDQCSDSADLHECGNGFCVSSDVKCSADVRVCGTQDTSCEPEVDEETTMTIVKMFQYFLVGMFILFVLVTVKMFCKRLKQTRDTDNCLESCCTGFCGCLFAMKQCCSKRFRELSGCLDNLHDRLRDICKRPEPEPSPSSRTSSAPTRDTRPQRNDVENARESPTRRMRHSDYITDTMYNSSDTDSVRPSPDQAGLPPSYGELMRNGTHNNSNSSRQSSTGSEDSADTYQSHFENTPTSSRITDEHDIELQEMPPPSYESQVRRGTPPPVYPAATSETLPEAPPPSYEEAISPDETNRTIER